jgi:hypothetical protein
VCQLKKAEITMKDKWKNLLRTSLFFWSLLFGLFACSTSKNIAGTYRSKFAIHGFFGTTVRLKSDSTLEYVFKGDLMYDSTTGHYQVYDDKLYITFDKELPDTNKLYYRFNEMPLKTIAYSSRTISYKLFYYIGHNKIYPAHVETGKKVDRARGYSKRKKFFFFGSHYYDRRYYYKRVD